MNDWIGTLVIVAAMVLIVCTIANSWRQQRAKEKAGGAVKGFFRQHPAAGLLLAILFFSGQMYVNARAISEGSMQWTKRLSRRIVVVNREEDPRRFWNIIAVNSSIATVILGGGVLNFVLHHRRNGGGSDE